MNTVPTPARMLATALSLVLVSLAGCISFDESEVNCSAKLTINPNPHLEGGLAVLDCEGKEEIWGDPDVSEAFSNLSHDIAISCSIRSNSISCDPTKMIQVEPVLMERAEPCVPVVFDWNKIRCEVVVAEDQLPDDLSGDLPDKLPSNLPDDEVDEVIDDEVDTKCLLRNNLPLCDNVSVPLG